MPGSVIDALVVTLGMDSKGFNDGIEKATQSLTGFATKVAGLALGFEGLAAGIKYFENLSTKMADLEFNARNLGVLGTSLSKLGEMAQMFGGSFDDAKGSVEGLQAAVYNLRFKGQMSEQLMALGMRGVKYLDPQGHILPEVDIARSVAAAIDRQAARTPGGMEQGQRRQMALDLLGSGAGGLANAAAAGVAKFDEVWKKVQEDQKGLTEKMLHDNAKMYQDIAIRGRTKKDIRNMPLLDALIPDIEKANEALQDLARAAIPMLTQGITDINNFFKNPPTWLSRFETSLKNLSDNFGPKGPLVVAIGGLAAALGVGKVVGSVAGAGAGLAAPALGELGLAAGVGVGAGFGLDWLDNLLGGHTFNALGRQSLFSPTEWKDYDPNNLPVAHGLINRAPVTPLAPRPTASGAGASPPTSMNGAPTTNITFENVTVTPRGQDGRAFANDFVDQTRRKFLAAASEGGLA